VETIEAFIFYFDLIGVMDQFIAAPDETLERLRGFQARARAEFPLSGPHSTVKTLADNVWARVNANEQSADVWTLELAARAMRAAEDFGFPRYFGAITRGEHSVDLADRTTIAGSDPTDFLVQHIDMTSEPHMRAALAEKWSAHLDRNKSCPVAVPSVWVSEEVFPDGTIDDSLFGLPLPFKIRRESFDLKNVAGPGGRSWPFECSRFRAIALR
jgi:hypothetical protein